MARAHGKSSTYNAGCRCDPCREARSEYDRRRYEANREEVIESARKYYEANREKALESGRRYNEANRERVAERKRRYNEANREGQAERDRRRRALLGSERGATWKAKNRALREMATTHGQRWSSAEDSLVLAGENESSGLLAARLGRTAESVRSRRCHLRKQGLIEAS